MGASAFLGTWAGTNGFRLMPADPLQDFPATAGVSSAAGGHLTLVAYAWQHPDDGPQDGLIVISASDGADGVAGTWGDSWHQKPEVMLLSGMRTAEPAISLEGSYAEGWSWRIRLELTENDELLLRMDNVISAENASGEMPAGPYPAMVLTARRSAG